MSAIRGAMNCLGAELLAAGIIFLAAQLAGCQEAVPGATSPDPAQVSASPANLAEVRSSQSAVALAPAATSVYDFASANFPSARARHRKPILGKLELSLLMGNAVVRGLDTYSTRRALTAPCQCNHELILPHFLADSTPRLALFSAGAVGLEFFLARRLAPRHPRLARLALLIDIAATSVSVGRNLAARTGLEGGREFLPTNRR